jgi:hypothetical protein
MNCANECSTAAVDTLQSSLETKLDDIKATLDRIEQILSYSVRGTAQGSRSELRQWSSSIATKIGLRLLRKLAKEAAPKHGETRQSEPPEHILISCRKCGIRDARDMQGRNTSKKSLEKPIDFSRYMQLDTLYKSL